MNLETMKSQFTGAYREAFDGAHKYILTQSFPAAYSDEKMAELYDLLLTAQEEGKPAENIVGEDITAFCKEYFSDYVPERRFRSFLGNLFAVSCMLVLGSLFDWLCAEEQLPLTQFRLNASPVLVGLGSGFVLTALFRLIQPLVMKTKKISAGGWAVIYLAVFVLTIIVCTVLLEGTELSVPGCPVLICAGAYALFYLAAQVFFRYRRTGSLLRKKEADPYKDSYYKNLEDKDIRRIIMKGWLRRYRKLAKRGKTTEETFRDEIARLEKINRISDKALDVFMIVVIAAAVLGTARESGVIDTIIYAVILCVVEYFIWLLFHKANRSNAATRQRLLADCDASGMTVPAYLAQELGETL